MMEIMQHLTTLYRIVDPLHLKLVNLISPPLANVDKLGHGAEKKNAI